MSTLVAALPDRARQVWAATRLDLLRLRRGRYRHARAFVVLLPALCSIVGVAAAARLGEQAQLGSTPAQTLAQATGIFWPLALQYCVFLAAVDVFGGLFRAELAERTLHHVFLQPLRRETVTIGKYLAGVLSLLGLGSLSWLIVLVAWLAPHGPAAVVGTLLSATGLKFLLSHVLALALALLAYGGLFLLAGMLARGPVVVGVMVWVWELLAIFLPTSFKRFTVAYWFNSLLPLRIPPKWMLAQEAEPATALAAVVVCVGFGAACTAVAAWWARHLQLSYGARD